MNKKYKLHEDFSHLKNIYFGDIKITPFRIKLMNTLGSITNTISYPIKDIKKTKKIIEGYRGEDIEVTIYEPQNIKTNAPCIINFHGGAFIFREFGHKHKIAMQYAHEVPCKVVFVHYRLAPEYPFPVGVEDCYASLLWVHSNSKELGINHNKIAVAGDSAGGDLAAAVTHMAKDRNGPKICFQMLVYPVLDSSQSTKSIKELSDGPAWNSNLNRQMWEYYLKDGDKGMLKYASPTSSKSFEGLPPAYIETEEFDCLRDEGNIYAEKLKKAGVDVCLNELKGTFHGFDSMYNKDIVRRTMATRIEILKRYLND